MFLCVCGRKTLMITYKKGKTPIHKYYNPCSRYKKIKPITSLYITSNSLYILHFPKKRPGELLERNKMINIKKSGANRTFYRSYIREKIRKKPIYFLYFD